MVEQTCRSLLRDRHEAEDATQQTFLSAYRALLGGTAPREPDAWLATIARNECLRRIRTGMREPLSRPEIVAADDQADVHSEAVSNLHAARLRKEIERLPGMQREVVLLREFAGLSYEELAAELGVSRRAIHSLLFRARATLRRRLTTAFTSLNLLSVTSAVSRAIDSIPDGCMAPGAASLSLAVKAAVARLSGALLVGGAVVSEHVLTKPSAHAPVVPPHAQLVPAAVALRAGAVVAGAHVTARPSRITQPAAALPSPRRVAARVSATDAGGQRGVTRDGPAIVGPPKSSPAGGIVANVPATGDAGGSSSSRPDARAAANSPPERDGLFAPPRVTTTAAGSRPERPEQAPGTP